MQWWQGWKKPVLIFNALMTTMTKTCNHFWYNLHSRIGTVLQSIPLLLPLFPTLITKNDGFMWADFVVSPYCSYFQNIQQKMIIELILCIFFFPSLRWWSNHVLAYRSSNIDDSPEYQLVVYLPIPSPSPRPQPTHLLWAGSHLPAQIRKYHTDYQQTYLQILTRPLANKEISNQ